MMTFYRRAPAVPFFGFRTMTKYLIVASGLGIAVWYIRSPFEHRFIKEDVWRIRLFIIESKILWWMARLGSVLRLGTTTTILRRLFHLESVVLARSPKSDIFTETLNADGVKIVVYRRLTWVTTVENPEMQLKPCLIYIHGGGFVYCCVEERDSHHRYFVEQLNCTVIAVDYRKAPEAPYPAAFLDCVTATKFIHDNSVQMGIDKTRITISGDSAGGNLAAAVALKLRDEGTKFLKNQVLIYPSVQFVNLRLNSYMERFPLLSRDDVVWLGLTYMNEPTSLSEAILDGDHIAEDIYQNPGFMALQKYDSTSYSESRALASAEALTRFRSRVKDPYLCPLMSRTMKGLPETLLLLCDFDVLLNDGLVYGERLATDGVTVTTIRIPGYHGCFRNFQYTLSGALMMDQLVNYLKPRL